MTSDINCEPSQLFFNGELAGTIGWVKANGCKSGALIFFVCAV